MVTPYKTVTLVQNNISLTIFMDTPFDMPYFGKCECEVWNTFSTTDWSIQRDWAKHVKAKHPSGV